MIQVKVEGLQHLQNVFDPKAFRKEIRLALNDAASKGRTAANREVFSKFNIKKRDLNQRVKIQSKASTANLTVVITAGGRPMSLAYFGAVWTRGRRQVSRAGVKTTKRAGRNQGVKVRILRGQAPTVLPNAFLGKVGGHVGVFERAGRSRLPIFERKLISPASMFEQSAPQKHLESTVQKTFVDRLDHYWRRRR